MFGIIPKRKDRSDIPRSIFDYTSTSASTNASDLKSGKLLLPPIANNIQKEVMQK
jgi:hypothetical protein